MMQAIATLATSQTAAQTATAQAATAPRPREPDVKDPDVFEGNREKLQGFLTECDMVFRLQPSRFGLDSTRVDYMISFLRGAPLLAVRPFLDVNPRPSELSDVASFKEYLKSNFGDPDEDGTARIRLAALRQDKTAAEYLVEIRGCLAILGWPEDGLVVDNTIKGLKDHIQLELVRHKRPKNLTELANIVIPFDNQTSEYYRMHRKPTSTFGTKNPVAASTPVATLSSGPPRSSTPARASPPVSRARGPLSQEEKDRRLREGLCSYCGGSGHFASDCPRRPQGSTPLPSLDVKPDQGKAKDPSS